MTIQAIETLYNGYRFRSRLEARWAVFFDALGWKYDYEPQGFELGDGFRYLPDFHLPYGGAGGRGLWVEIKPDAPLAADDLEKICRFHNQSDTDLLLLRGGPWPGKYSGLVLSPRSNTPMRLDVLAPCPCCGGPLTVAGDEEFTAGMQALEVMQRAYALARGARFEHGEHGAPSTGPWGPTVVGNDGIARRAFRPRLGA